MALIPRERTLCNGINPWLAPAAMLLTQDVALRYFRRITVLGRDHLPHHGAVLLAPTHRARWDALLLPHAAGRRVTGRDCRFMVSIDEMVGVQGWFLHRLGCFPINPRKPATASLRFAVDLLQHGQQLVVFPEGQIHQHHSRQPHTFQHHDPQQPGALRLRPGLARLAQLACNQGVAVTVVPVGIAYSHARPRLCDAAALCFGEPLHLGERCSLSPDIKAFNLRLAEAMRAAEGLALDAVGRPRAAA